MKTIDKEMALFGDLYYNATREEVARLAESMKKYPINAISSYLKLIMQDVLAHLAGSTSFEDACMVRGKVHFESKINNMIGKRKLVELLSLLEELDKLEIHVDELELPSNESDAFLKNLIKNRRKGILQEYLEFHTLDEFFDMVMMVVSIMPMAKRMEEFNSFIPDPMDFDFKNKYYESIDYLLYYMDNDKHDSLIDKHKIMGREVNLIEWINNYKNRYSIKDLLREEMGLEAAAFDGDVVCEEEIPNDMTEKIINFASQEYDFNDDELEHLAVIAKDNVKEIYLLKTQIVEMRSAIVTVLETQYINLSDEEYKKCEDEFVMETFIKHVTKKTRKKRGAILMIFAAVIASLVLMPTFDLKKSSGEKNKLTKNEHVGIETSDDFELEDEEKKDIIEIVIPYKPDEIIDEKPYELEQDDDEDDFVHNTEFVLGEIVSENVPFYISSTSDEILGFLDDDVVVIGYFGVLEGKEGRSVFWSCRSQEQMDKVLRLYHGDGKDIMWRAAVARKDNPRVQEYLASGEEIPYDLTICYIDCVPVKELNKIRGK